ncbi:PEF-CTERM sorting domain-containing protein [Methanolobus sp.]|uniref:PEF-CTERM sorting domain-containing protein n=1 Tax=Methanolobus sp. TaxID=1874737 RepID=UPI0025DB0600|nr:PEF-CTERM sorting domain-containing protein [Methanolobus sp.]
MKRLIIVALMALIAMIGTASAYTPDVWDAAGEGPIGDLKLSPGDTVVLSYRMQSISSVEYGMVLNYTQQVSVVSGGGSESDIVITTPENVTVPEASTYTDVGAITISIAANAPAGTIYRVSIGAGPVTIESEVDSASRYVNTEIPEFPTIALPVAAILGLAFFMQRRKEE